MIYSLKSNRIREFQIWAKKPLISISSEIIAFRWRLTWIGAGLVGNRTYNHKGEICRKFEWICRQFWSSFVWVCVSSLLRKREVKRKELSARTFRHLGICIRIWMPPFHMRMPPYHIRMDSLRLLIFLHITSQYVSLSCKSPNMLHRSKKAISNVIQIRMSNEFFNLSRLSK